jgi:serine/threonine-protein kinase
MRMVYVPAGEFEMGGEGDASREQPVHTVALDAFWIDRTEVTNAQYRLCVEAGVCQAPPTCYPAELSPYADTSKSEHPVVCVNWHSARAYCEWAAVRLPTEAEWEYAARGPKWNVFPWGDEFDGTQVNYCDTSCGFAWADETFEDGYEDTAPVGSYPSGASWCGALDMAGNVSEWVADWYGSYYYERSPSENPTGPPSGSRRVERGGSWLDYSHSTRSAQRAWGVPSVEDEDLGFRCARGSE